MKVKEYLNKGLVQTRHPLELEPGELQTATNTHVRPGDRSIHRAPGRTAYGTVNTISGITCNVSGTDLVATGGSFATLVTVTLTVADQTEINSAGAFGSVTVGQSIWGTGVPVGARVKEKISSNQIIIDRVMTAGTTTIYHGDIHVDTFVTGAGITDGNQVASVTDATNLVLVTAEGVQSSFGCIFADAIDGLKFLPFDDSKDDILLAKTDHKLFSSPAIGVTGTFTELKAGLSGDEGVGLETVGFKNKYAIMTGQDDPRVLYYADSEADGIPILKDRAMGMLPVSSDSFAGPTILSGANWPDAVGDNSKYGPGWYHFVMTEVMEVDDGTTIEGTYEGDWKSIFLTDPASEGIRVVSQEDVSQPVNDGLGGRNLATHWRVYMSLRHGGTSILEEEDPTLGEFVQVGEAPITQNSMLLGNTNPVRFGYPAAIVDIAGFTPLFDTANNVLSKTPTQTLTECAYAADSFAITSAAKFGTVTSRMPVFSPANDLPPYQFVTWKKNSSEIGMAKSSSAANADVDLYFGNEPSINHKTDFISDEPESNDYRAGLFHSFSLGDTIGNFAGATITGIRVEINGRHLSNLPDPGLEVTLYRAGDTLGSPAPNKQIIFVGQHDDLQSAVRGGPNDLWGHPSGTWVSTDFADGITNFAVKVRALRATDINGKRAYGSRWEIDGIKVTVWAGSGDISIYSAPFPVITIRDQLGTALETPANGPPPRASTGDHFNGVLVLNDVKNRSLLWGSVPDNEEAFPAIYQIPIQSGGNDHVTVIKRLGKILVLGLKNSVKRMNYFPLEIDSDFNRGRAYEDIATDHGMVGPKSSMLLDLPGRGTVLTYLSHRGLYWTDGINAYPLNIDIDWENLFNFSYIENAQLTVYPRLYQLALNYTPAGATYNSKCLIFSYHPTHMKEGGQLPAFGPNGVNAQSATSGLIGGQSYLFTGHSFLGKVYQEDDGTVNNEDGDTLAMVVRTRKFTPGRGQGTQGRVNNLSLLTDADGNTTSGLFTSTFYRQNQGEADTADNVLSDRHTTVGGIIKLWQEMFGDTFDLEIQKGLLTSDMRIHNITFDTDDAGESTA